MDNKEKQVRKTLERHKDSGLIRYESEVLIDVIDSLRKQLTEERDNVSELSMANDMLRERAEKAEADRESEMKNRDDAEVKLGRCYEEKEALRQENKRLLAEKKVFLKGLDKIQLLPSKSSKKRFVFDYAYIARKAIIEAEQAFKKEV